MGKCLTNFEAKFELEQPKIGLCFYIYFSALKMVGKVVLFSTLGLLIRFWHFWVISWPILGQNWPNVRSRTYIWELCIKSYLMPEIVWKHGHVWHSRTIFDHLGSIFDQFWTKFDL